MDLATFPALASKVSTQTSDQVKARRRLEVTLPSDVLVRLYNVLLSNSTTTTARGLDGVVAWSTTSRVPT